ncbi:MAG TPA: hypothetical protein VM327_06520 [Candidatus Thermoplasmatota archaeon]|nr:hypothetical protein [Candidatus Thermoplasmatota archaeon]
MDALQLARGLFVAAGAIHLLIGLLTPLFGFPPGIVGLSKRSDRQMWNRTSPELLEDPVVRELRTHHHIVIAGLLCGLGVMELAMAWFGIPSMPGPALYSLMAMGAVMFPYWIGMVLQFTRRGVDVTLWDVQPFVWAPTFLWAAGSVCAFVALRPV